MACGYANTASGGNKYMTTEVIHSTVRSSAQPVFALSLNNR